MILVLSTGTVAIIVWYLPPQESFSRKNLKFSRGGTILNFFYPDDLDFGDLLCRIYKILFSRELCL